MNAQIQTAAEFELNWSEFASVNDDPDAYTGTWHGLVQQIKDTKAADKSSCPLVKLADFGNNRNGRTSLRNNANVTAVNGIEGDYDQEQMPIEDAQMLLNAAGVKAVLYTTPSNLPGKPRWRALCPTSKPIKPQERAPLVARLNGVLGGVLAGESFTLSQAYYFGDVGTNDYRVIEIEGEFIDTMEQLDAVAIGKQKEKSKPVEPSAPPPAGLPTVAQVAPELIPALRSAFAFMPSDDRDLWQRMGHAVKNLGEVGKGLWLEWSKRSDKFDPEDAERVWNSFNPTSTGYAAVFAEAQRQGWKNSASTAASIESASMDQLEASIVRLDTLSEKDDEPMPHVVECWIPEDEVTLLSGHGGDGKSYGALSVGVHVVLGRPFGELTTQQTGVLFFSGEDSGRVLRHRVRRLCRALNIDPKSLEGNLHLLDASDLDAALHREHRVGGINKTETPLLENLAALVEKLGVGLVIVDNASDTFDDDEIKRVRVRQFVKSLRSRIARPGRAVLLLAHINKASASNRTSTEDYSGSTAWHNSVRSRLSLISEKGGSMRIEHQKANHGEKAEPVKMEWVDGVPLIAGTAVDPDRVLNEAARKANERARDEAHKRVLVAIIQSFDQRGEKIPSTVFGRASAYNTVRTHPDFPKVLDADRFVGLIRELEAEGIVRRYGYKHDYKSREGLTCAAQGV